MALPLVVAATSTAGGSRGETRCLGKVLKRGSGVRRARGEKKAGRGRGLRGGEKKAAISQTATGRDCTAGRGISKESYSAGCQAVCSASAY